MMEYAQVENGVTRSAFYRHRCRVCHLEVDVKAPTARQGYLFRHDVEGIDFLRLKGFLKKIGAVPGATSHVDDCRVLQFHLLRCKHPFH